MTSDATAPAKGFAAFASGSPARDETLETAIDQINTSGVADLLSWSKLNIGGRLLISTICETIEDRPLFLADVTVLNPNVLFELGFAIARMKRIWLLLDESHSRSRSEFERFQLLTTVGYRPYANSRDIVRYFMADQPNTTLDSSAYRDIFDVPLRNPASKLLYLKSEIETDASIKVSQRVDQARLSVYVDDPAEMRLQSLPWYARHANSSLGVIAHLLNNEHTNALFHLNYAPGIEARLR